MNTFLLFIDIHQFYLDILPYFGYMKWMFVFLCSLMGLKFLWNQLHEFGGLVFAFFYILISDDAQEFRGFQRKKYIGKALKIIGKNQKDRLKKVFALMLEQMVNQIWSWFLDPSQKYLVIYYRTRRYMHLSTTHHDAEKEVDDALTEFVRGKKWYGHPLYFIGKWLVIMHFKGSDCKPSLKALKELVNLNKDCDKEIETAAILVEQSFSELIRYRFQGATNSEEVNSIQLQLNLTVKELNEVFSRMSQEKCKLKAEIHKSDQDYVFSYQKACTDFKALPENEKEAIEDTEKWLSDRSLKYKTELATKKEKEVTDRFVSIQKQLGDTGSSLTKRREKLKKLLREAEHRYYKNLKTKFDKASEYWFELMKIKVDIDRLNFWERCLNQVIWEDEMTMRSLQSKIKEANLKIINNDFTTLEAYQLADLVSRSKEELAIRKGVFELNHINRNELNDFHAQNLKSVLLRKKKTIQAYFDTSPTFVLPPALTAENTKGN